MVVELNKLVARGAVGGVSVGERFCMAKSKFSYDLEAPTFDLTILNSTDLPDKY